MHFAIKRRVDNLQDFCAAAKAAGVSTPRIARFRRVYVGLDFVAGFETQCGRFFAAIRGQQGEPLISPVMRPEGACVNNAPLATARLSDGVLSFLGSIGPAWPKTPVGRAGLLTCAQMAKDLTGFDLFGYDPFKMVDYPA